MKNISQKITALLFLIAIFAMLLLLALNHADLRTEILYYYRNSINEESSFLQKINSAIDVTEEQLNQRNPLRNTFIDLNGGFQRLVGKRVIEDADPTLKVHRLDNGQLTFTVHPTETDWKVKKLATLSDFCQNQGTPLLYVQAPFKIDPFDPQLPTGTEDHANENADHLLKGLKEQNIPTLDLREAIKMQGLDHSKLFYRTDSHWNTEAAFWAYTTLCDTLKNNYGFSVDPSVTDRKNFDLKTYQNIFLGSQGKRVGSLYAGADDVDVLLPQFETKLRYDVPVHSFSKEGAFQDTVMDYAHVQTKDYYNKSPYYVYSGGDYPLTHIKNLNNPNGKKILLIRDSFSCAVAPFLALAAGQVDTFDVRYNDTPVQDYIAESQPDIVIVLYNAGAIGFDQLFEY